MRDDASLEAHVQQLADGFLTVLAVIEGSFVDVHSDESVCHGRIQVASELHGVGECFIAVVKCMLNAAAESIRGGQKSFCAQRAADRVAS